MAEFDAEFKVNKYSGKPYVHMDLGVVDGGDHGRDIPHSTRIYNKDKLQNLINTLSLALQEWNWHEEEPELPPEPRRIKSYSKKVCGCIEVIYEDLENVINMKEQCLDHTIQFTYFLFLHYGGYHEECCDLPNFIEAINRHGEQAIRQAAHNTLTDKQAAYVERLISLANEQ